MDKTRDFFFDNIKGMLILFVVFGHALKPLMLTSELATFLYAFVYVFHMPFFVFISGYFSKTSNNSKLISLTYTYLLWQMIICPVVIYIFIGNFSKSFQTPINPQWTYWYLLSLIVWKFTTPIINKFIKLKYLLPTSIILSVLIGFFNFPWWIMTIGRTITFYPLFLLGYSITKEKLEIYKHKFNKIYASLVLLGVAFVTSLMFIINKLPLDAVNMRGAFVEYTNNMLFGALIRLLLYFLAILCMISISTFISDEKTFLSTIGKNSILVYLTHGFVIKSLEANLDYTPLLNNPIIGLLVIAMLSFIYCYFLSSNKFINIFKLTLSPPKPMKDILKV